MESPHSHSLVVVVVGPERKQAGILAQLESRLRRRGLQARWLRNRHDTAMDDFDVLLIGCREEEAAPLAEQLERLWTQKWSRWYATISGWARSSAVRAGHS